MFINKTTDGLNNICGKKISELRKNLKISLSTTEKGAVKGR